MYLKSTISMKTLNQMKNINKFLSLLAICLLIFCINAQAQFDFKSPLELPKNEKYSIVELSCKNQDGKNIYGVAYIPKGSQMKKYPTVIFSHGYSSSHIFHSYYGCTLAENGIACYSFDFCGGSNISKSDGKTTEMSVLTEKQDLGAVLNAVKTWDFVDPTNIFLCGESQGGFVSALAAVDHENDLKGMVLLYPAFHIPDAMRKMFPDKNGIKDVMDFPADMKIGRCYVDAVYDMDAYKATKGFKKEVLIIHGDKDEAVPLAFAERAAKEYPLAELRIIKGAGHGYYVKEHKEEVLGYFVNYINKKLNE